MFQFCSNPAFTNDFDIWNMLMKHDNEIMLIANDTPKMSHRMVNRNEPYRLTLHFKMMIGGMS